jgi:choice-of-anchor C domain-containing protein
LALARAAVERDDARTERCASYRCGSENACESRSRNNGPGRLSHPTLGRHIILNLPNRESAMRLIPTSFALLIVLSFTFAAPAPKPTNLLVNGSFEEGPEDIGEFKSFDKDSDAIKGWKVTRAQIDLIGTYFTAFDGKRCIDLHGSPGYGGIAQTFKTKKAAKYKVELQLASTPGAGERGIWVEAAGDKKKFEVDSGESTRDKLGWKKVTWEFTATGAETTLEIYTTEKGDPNQGPIIDDVVVAEK